METAQLWYYKDSAGQEQGPQPAAGMRQWYEAGYFAGDVNVAASYYGEVPCTFWPISELWQNPATEAFVRQLDDEARRVLIRCAHKMC